MEVTCGEEYFRRGATGVAIQSRYGIPCVGSGPGAESQDRLGKAPV
jgi:hypothetical protein